MAKPKKDQDRLEEPESLSDDELLYIRTYLVRVGLLMRGMLLRGRIAAFNKSVNEAKKGEPIEDIQAAMIKDIHPAMPSSEVQFWLMGDSSNQLETWFSIVFLEILSGKLQIPSPLPYRQYCCPDARQGLPVKSVEAVRYLVEQHSVMRAYRNLVRLDPTHKVYKITLPSTQWALDPCGARMGYEDILVPWEAFEALKLRKDKYYRTLAPPDLASYEKRMGICNHAGAPDKKAASAGQGLDDEEEPFERRALRAWTACWVDLLAELFGGSMSNIGCMSHASFSVAMDEFLAVMEAYVKAYLLDTSYYRSTSHCKGQCLPWATKMYNGHPAGGPCYCGRNCPDDETSCEAKVEEAFRRKGSNYDVRWMYRRRVEEVTGRKPENLSKKKLLRTVEKLLVDRAGVKLEDCQPNSHLP